MELRGGSRAILCCFRSAALPVIARPSLHGDSRPTRCSCRVCQFLRLRKRYVTPPPALTLVIDYTCSVPTLFDFPSPLAFRQSFFALRTLPAAEQILSVDFLAPIVVRFSFIVSRAAGFLYATTRGGGANAVRRAYRVRELGPRRTVSLLFWRRLFIVVVACHDGRIRCPVPLHFCLVVCCSLCTEPCFLLDARPERAARSKRRVGARRCASIALLSPPNFEFVAPAQAPQLGT